MTLLLTSCPPTMTHNAHWPGSETRSARSFLGAFPRHGHGRELGMLAGIGATRTLIAPLILHAHPGHRIL